MLSKLLRLGEGRKVEQQNFEVRKNVLKYDEVMNQQRKVVYAERRLILEGESVQDQAKQMVDDVIVAYVDGATAEGYSEDWELPALWDALKLLYPVSIDHHDLIDSGAVGEPGELTRDELREALLEDAKKAYAAREAELAAIGGDTAMRQLERSAVPTRIYWKRRGTSTRWMRRRASAGAPCAAPSCWPSTSARVRDVQGDAELDQEESVGSFFNAQVEAQPCPSSQAGAPCGPAPGPVRPPTLPRRRGVAVAMVRSPRTAPRRDWRWRAREFDDDKADR